MAASRIAGAHGSKFSRNSDAQEATVRTCYSAVEQLCYPARSFCQNVVAEVLTEWFQHRRDPNNRCVTLTQSCVHCRPYSQSQNSELENSKTSRRFTLAETVFSDAKLVTRSGHFSKLANQTTESQQ